MLFAYTAIALGHLNAHISGIWGRDPPHSQLGVKNVTLKRSTLVTTHLRAFLYIDRFLKGEAMNLNHGKRMLPSNFLYIWCELDV